MSPAMPKQMQGLLDPEAMRRAQIKQALLTGGLAMLGQGPSDKPINLMTSIGQGLGKGVEAAQQTGKDYRDVAYQTFQMNQDAEKQQYERDWNTKKFDYDVSQDGLNNAYREKQLAAELAAKAKQGGPEYGLNPVWLQNGEGKWMLVQPSKDGSAPRPMEFPQGYNPAPQNRTVDTGTGYVTMPTRGEGAPVGGVIPKNLEAEAAAKKLGTDQGENLALLRSMKAKLPGLERVVDDLDTLADKATYTLTGQLYNEGRKQIGMAPSDGAVARTQYAATVANQVLPLLRDTFGAQFTAAEGERLLATLGNPDVSPPEKKAVLRAFIEQKKRDIEGLAVQTGQAAPPQGGNAADPLGIR
jgi:hypothetical protein